MRVQTSRGLSRGTFRTLLLAGFVLGVAGLVVAGHIASPAEYTGQPVISASSSGPAIALPAGAADANFADFAINDSALRIQTHGGGNATFVASGATFAVAESIHGRWANLTSIDVGGTELHMSADARPPATVSGALDTFALRDEIHPDDGHVDFTYSGTSGTTNVTVGGLNPNVQYFAWDERTEKSLATGTADANGVVTFAGMPNSAHAIMIHKQPMGGTPDSDLLGDISLAHAVLLTVLVGLLAVMTFTMWSKIAMFGLVVSGLMVGLLMVGLIPADLAVLIVVAAVALVGAIGVWGWGGL